jgi:glutamate dehydrogenase/leucine dehydrogenase
MPQNEGGETFGPLKEGGLVNILEDINVSAFLDSWGPRNVMQVYNPEINMQGILVIDNIVLGPACGRIRISNNVTPREIHNDARVMTWSTALLDLNMGGAAAGIKADPTKIDKVQFIQSFARKVSPYVPDKFIAAPGDGVGQEEMKAFVDEVGDIQGATGKPEELGGIPTETGIVGLGIGVAIDAAVQLAPSSLGLPKKAEDLKVAIQGSDIKCSKLARFLDNRGYKVIAVSDEECTIHDQKGIEIDRLLKIYRMENTKSSLRRYKGAKFLEKEDIVGLKCDLLICTRPSSSCLDEQLKKVKAKCIIEGSSNSLSSITDQILNKKGIMILPDIITTGGAAIGAYAEHSKVSIERAFAMVDSKIRTVTKEAIQRSMEMGIPLRRVAREIAKDKILKALEAYR